MHRHTRHAMLAAMAAVLALSVALFGAASASSATKAYSVVVTPGSVAGGSTVTLTAIFTDRSATQDLGSANLFWPSTIAVLSASVPAPLPQPTLSTTCTFGTVHGPCVQLRGLGLSPGHSVSVTMTVQTPPACSAVSGAWAVEAKQANNFNGSGNDLSLDSAHSSLSTTVTDSCHLQYATEPHGVVVGQHITGSDYDTSGPPVSVDVLDASGLLVTSSTAAVTTAFASNPGGAVLGGTTTQTAVAGVATFADLSVDKPGNNDTLAASSAGMTSTTSSAFSAQALGTACAGVSCSLSATAPGGNGQVVAQPVNSSSTGTLVESANATGNGPVTCTGYTTSDPNTYEFITTSPNFSKVVTITITAPIGAPPFDKHDNNGFTIPGGDGDHDYDDVLWNSQLCLQAPHTFATRSGTPLTQSTLPDGTIVYTGLLPDCPAAGPCHDRSSDKVVSDPSSPVKYDIVLVGNIPAGTAGDPRMN